MKIETIPSTGVVIDIGLCDQALAQPEAELRGIARAVMRQKSSQRWYITALVPEDDERCSPIGPFDTYETALVTLRLMQ